MAVGVLIAAMGMTMAVPFPAVRVPVVVEEEEAEDVGCKSGASDSEDELG
jgi:hypothetical protein